MLNRFKNWLPSTRSYIHQQLIGVVNELNNTMAEQCSTFVDECSRICAAVSQQGERVAALQEYVSCLEDMQDTMSKLSEYQQQLCNILTSLQQQLSCDSLDPIRSTLADMESKIATLYPQITQELQTTRDLLPGHAFLLDVTFERAYYKDFPTFGTQETPNFEVDFRALVQGLDRESLQTILLALKRLSIIQDTPYPVLDLYSSTEQQQGRAIIEEFLSCVQQLSEHCFFWNGYYLPNNHFESCVFLDQCGVTQLKNPAYFADKDIIDAGAFIGDSAIVFSPLTSGVVHAFEPVPENYELMQKTLSLNNCKNVIPCNLALGKEKDIITISVNDSSSTQYENSAFSYAQKIEARVVTIDEYVAEHDLHVGLIKADLEGAEQSMLVGAMHTLQTQRPTLLISIYHTASDFFHIKPMLEALNLGYRFRIFHPTFGSVMTEMMLIAEIEEA